MGYLPLQFDRPSDLPTSELAADVYMLGALSFQRIVPLQRRLAYEVGEALDPRLVLLLCEHEELITVGRSGSRAHIRIGNEQLQRAGVGVQWVGRGGGCIPHGRGQLAIYSIVPLRLAGWSVGDYLRRLQVGLTAAVQRFNVPTAEPGERFGVWGQSGQLAAIGVAVRNWTTGFGAYLNVHPRMNLFHHVDTEIPTARGEKTSMSSLLAERRVAVTMSSVRTAVVESLAAALGCSRFHVHAAHPSLSSRQELAGESCPRV